MAWMSSQAKQPADTQMAYVLYPHDSLVIEGFRKSDDAVASFVFSNPEDSYAANSDKGSIKNTGVIWYSNF